MESELYWLIVPVAFVAAIANTVAGGGSLLVMPLLAIAGLPPHVANGTIRLGVLAQTATAFARFAQHRQVNWRITAKLCVPVTLGALPGVLGTTFVPSEALRATIGGVTAAAAVVALLPVRRNPVCSAESGKPHRLRHPVLTPVLMFLVGCYGSFIQLGVGFIIIAVLTRVEHQDLRQANVIKVVSVLAYTCWALPAYGGLGLVRWDIGALLAVAQASGAWIGSRIVLQADLRWLRLLIFACAAAAAGALLF